MSSILSRGYQDTIDDTVMSEGMFRFGVDSCRLFVDTAHERLEISDFVKGLTFREIMALEHPLPKMYLASDTHQLLLYDNVDETWIAYAGAEATQTIEAKVQVLQDEVRELKEMITLVSEGE